MYWKPNIGERNKVKPHIWVAPYSNLTRNELNLTSESQQLRNLTSVICKLRNLTSI